MNLRPPYHQYFKSAMDYSCWTALGSLYHVALKATRGMWASHGVAICQWKQISEGLDDDVPSYSRL
ncbi:hypothetical protein EYF80_044644 [Liparis tanakae]|uniref:Uncharacterized protein n=1 Tax=Liparis tanakae TaxID=230148 RepID=A0A4Z2FV88_9TELE|nr:hypothetical protein EYF80_044644 [Liparis tanakae]